MPSLFQTSNVKYTNYELNTPYFMKREKLELNHIALASYGDIGNLIYSMKLIYHF